MMELEHWRGKNNREQELWWNKNNAGNRTKNIEGKKFEQENVGNRKCSDKKKIGKEKMLEQYQC